MARPVLVVVVGPMFAGKTTQIIAGVQPYFSIKRRVVYFRPKIANRDDGDIIISHGKIVLEGLTPTLLNNLDRASEMILAVGRQHDVIVVDEGHFLPVDVFRALAALHAEGKTVFFCGCDTDFLGEPFDTVARVMALPEAQIIKLTAFCALCEEPATRSQKLVDGRPAPPTSARLETGGEEKYRALCLACFRTTNAAPVHKPAQRPMTVGYQPAYVYGGEE